MNGIAPGSIDTPRFRKVLDKTPGAENFVEGLKRSIPVRRLGTWRVWRTWQTHEDFD